MTTEIQTETEIQETCAKCDAEIRPGSQFCFSCGEAVADADEIAEDSNVVAFPVTKKPEAVEEDEPEEIPMPEEVVSVEPEPEEAIVAESIPTEPVELPKDRRRRRNERMETAASIKKRERLRVKKPAEIVWDTPRSSMPFAIAAIVILAISFLIFYFAIYGK